MGNDLVNLLFPPIRQRVLAELLLEPDRTFHLRELARVAGVHPGTLGRELQKLSAAGLLLKSAQGNQSRFQANERSLLFADLASMFRKTHGAVAALRQALAPFDHQFQLAFIYGSTASGTRHRHSDIDVLLLAETSLGDLLQATFPLHQALGREVNTTLYRPAEFAQRVRRRDGFACGVVAKPKLWIKGTDDELAKLVGQPLAASAHAG